MRAGRNASCGDLESRRVHELLDEIAHDARRLVARSLMLAPSPEGRAQTRVAAVPGAEAWLVVWAPGSATGMYDDGASSGIVRVLRGSLVVRSATTDRLRPRTRRLRAGSTAWLDGGLGRELRNAGRDEAVSLHVYAPCGEGSEVAVEPMAERERVLARA